MSGLENLACLLAASASGSEIFRALSYGALKFGKKWRQCPWAILKFLGRVHERRWNFRLRPGCVHERLEIFFAGICTGAVPTKNIFGIEGLTKFEGVFKSYFGLNRVKVEKVNPIFLNPINPILRRNVQKLKKILSREARKFFENKAFFLMDFIKKNAVEGLRSLNMRFQILFRVLSTVPSENRIFRHFRE